LNREIGKRIITIALMIHKAIFVFYDLAAADYPSSWPWHGVSMGFPVGTPEGIRI